MSVRNHDEFGGIGVERGQAVEGKAALVLRERLGNLGRERRQPVKFDSLALELREHLGGLRRKRGQAVEGQELSL